MRGHIVRPSKKNGRKSWGLVISRRDPDSGKLVQRWYSFPTRAAAESYQAQVRTQIEGGSYMPKDETPFGDYLTTWLKDSVEVRVSARTLDDYRRIVEKHLRPALGTIPLRALSAQDIDKYLSARVREGLSPGTVHKHFAVLRRALTVACQWGRLGRNPAAMVSPPRVEEYDAKPWDGEELALFLAEARRSSRHHALFLTLALCGLRISEALALRWEDVDLATGTAEVRRSLSRVGKQVIFKAPKSRAGRRTIFLPPVVAEALRALAERQRTERAFFGEEYADLGLVFCQPNGKPLHARNLSRGHFQAIVKRAKLRRVRLHDLRHGFVSHMAASGVPLRVAQELAGHSSPALTLRIYSHTWADQKAAAARALEERILGRLMSTDEQNRPAPRRAGSQTP